MLRCFVSLSVLTLESKLDRFFSFTYQTMTISQRNSVRMAIAIICFISAVALLIIAYFLYKNYDKRSNKIDWEEWKIRDEEIPLIEKISDNIWKHGHSTITLLKDGTASYLGSGGTWHIKDGKLVIITHEGMTDTFHFYFSDDYSTLYLRNIAYGEYEAYSKQ